MSFLVPTQQNERPFELHPAGRHICVCADIYSIEKLNRYFGMKDEKRRGGIDERKTQHYVRFVFLSSLLMSDGRPYFISRDFAAFGGPTSGLYNFVIAWHPELSGVDLTKYDSEGLIGTGADATIVHKQSADKKKTYANIALVTSLRDGDVVPQIPSDFKRADVRKKQEWEDKAINKQFPDFQIRYAEPQSGPALSPSPLQQRPAFSPAPVQSTNAPSSAQPVFGGQAPQQGEQRPFTPVEATPDERSQINDLPF